MRFDCRFEYYPKPFEPSDFLRHYVIDVMVYNELPGADSLVLGRIAVDYLDLARAALEGESVYQICDCDSGYWEYAYKAIFEEHGENVDLKTEFQVCDIIQEVLFIHELVIHPMLVDWRMYIISNIAEMFSCHSAMITWQKLTGLSERQLSDLGFSKIAGRDLILRPNMNQPIYDHHEDRRNPIDLEASEEMEEWVLEEWARLVRP